MIKYECRKDVLHYENKNEKQSILHRINSYRKERLSTPWSFYILKTIDTSRIISIIQCSITKEYYGSNHK